MTDPAALAHQLYVALMKGDGIALEALVHPDFVGVAAEGLPLGIGGRYVGLAAMCDGVWWRFGRHWRVEVVAEETNVLDDGRLLVSGRYVGAARESGASLDAAFTHVIEFRDGRISALTQLTDTAAWQATAPLERIRYSVADGVAHLELDRPDALNAIDLQLAQDFLAAVLRLRADSRVRAVLISGRGPALTVGGDIGYFTSRLDEDLGPALAEMTSPFHEAFRILASLDAPIVCAAHGAVAGGGLGFVYAADITLASEDARFVTAFADIALPGDGGGTWHLPRIIGAARAKQVYLENRPITAQEALEWGLVAEVYPADELQDQARALAVRLAAGPTRAFGHMRALLRDTWTNPLSAQLDAETQHLLEAGRGHDVREAIAAFGERRPARFEGR